MRARSTRPAILLAVTALITCAARDAASAPAHPGWKPTHFPGDAPRPAAGASCQLTYGGGAVISRVQAVAVYWSTASATVAGWAPGFLSAIVASPYVDALSEYNTAGHANGTNQKIQRGTFLSAITITPSTNAKSVQDTQVGAELQAQITAGKLPAPTVDETGHTNTLYVVFFPPGYTISDQGGSSCQQGGFCGYHSSFVSGKSVPYAVIPDQGGGCAQGCGQGQQTDLLGSIVSHEVAEAITDEGVGESAFAWMDQGACDGEIGDICDPAGGGTGANAGTGTLSGYTMQNEWSNANATCELSNPTIGPQGGCAANADCAAPTPKCNTTTHTCVACVTGADCAGATPVCDAKSAACRACAPNAECPAAAPICATSGSCVACVHNADCTSAAPVCASGACKGCGSDADCTDPARPRCDTATGACGAAGASSSGATGSSSGGSGGGSGATSSGSGGGSRGNGSGGSAADGNGYADDSDATGSSGGCVVGGESSPGTSGIVGALLGVAAVARSWRARRRSTASRR